LAILIMQRRAHPGDALLRRAAGRLTSGREHQCAHPEDSAQARLVPRLARELDSLLHLPARASVAPPPIGKFAAQCAAYRIFAVAAALSYRGRQQQDVKRAIAALPTSIKTRILF
jgi:hypothetical protein